MNIQEEFLSRFVANKANPAPVPAEAKIGPDEMAVELWGDAPWVRGSEVANPDGDED